MPRRVQRLRWKSTGRNMGVGSCPNTPRGAWPRQPSRPRLISYRADDLGNACAGQLGRSGNPQLLVLAPLSPPSAPVIISIPAWDCRHGLWERLSWADEGAGSSTETSRNL